MKKVILIDGNGLIFRAYFATMTHLSINQNGIPTNAIYLFSSIILRLIEKHDFDNIIVALDSPGKKFRHQEYKDYKANRKEVPPELKMQFAPIKEFLNIANIKTLEIEGYEADDVIGTLVKNAQNHDVFLEVYTGDRDLLQLINDNANINMMHKGLSEVECFDANHLMEVYELKPRQVIDLKALMGDASDNIPGVKGIGEKTAISLIKEYESLDNIYANIENIKGKLKDKLSDGKDMAYLSYELATIYQDVPLDFSVLDEIYEHIDEYALNDFLKKYNIKSLLKYSKEKEKKEEELKITPKIVEKISKDLENEHSFIYLDLDNDNYHQANLKGIAIANKFKAEYIPFDYLMFDFDFTFYLSNKEISKNVFDLKKTIIILNKYGYEINNVKVDYLLAFYLINPNLLKIKDIFNSFGLDLDEPKVVDSFEISYLYSSLIAYYSSLTFDSILAKIKEINNETLFNNVEMPLARILSKMEKNGVLIDTNLLNTLDLNYNNKLNDITNKIQSLINDDTINLNSPKQLAILLYDKLNLPSNKKRTTTAEDLNYIKDMHPVIPLILEYRKYNKLLSTYVDSFKNYIYSDNRIHTMFNQASTITGRLSSSCPNLQNLSIKDEDRSVIRKLIIAKDGYKIISLDYSQIELRILAILSNDENMLNAFKNDIDVHRLTASKIFNVELNEVNEKQRRVAKAVNFGIVYGISPWGLANQIGYKIEDASKFIDTFFESYQGIKRYLANQIENCQTNGYVTTLYNRRRLVPEINSSNYNIKEFGKRIAMNSPIQGSAADIIKIAMIRVDELIANFKDDIMMICQIHDELLFEVKEEKADMLAKMIAEIMENVICNQKIKLKVSYSIGTNWLEAK